MAAMPEIMPNATTLSTQFSGCSSASICAGSRSCTGVSWAIQMPSHTVANAPIHPAETRRTGSPSAATGWSFTGRPARAGRGRGSSSGVGHSREGVGGRVRDRPGGVVVAIDEPGEGESVGERDEHARHLARPAPRHVDVGVARPRARASARRARRTGRTGRAASGCRSGDRSAYWVSSSIACSCSGSALRCSK